MSAFLVTHFPGEIQNCGLLPSVAANSLAIIGLFNVVGSVGAGMLGQRSHEVSARAHLRCTRGDDRHLSGDAEDVTEHLLVRGWHGDDVAGDGAAYFRDCLASSIGLRYLGTLFGSDARAHHQIGAIPRRLAGRRGDG